MTASDQSAAAEIGQVARGSVINLAAMALGAILAFGLTVMVSRWLQPSGAGGFFELIALSTIASNVLYLGADTGLIRWISRARAIGGITSVRRIVRIALLPVLIVGAGAAVAIWVAAPELARTFLGDMHAAPAITDIHIIAPFVPLGALSAVILAGSRGFNRMWPYLAIEGLGKPTARLALVLVALLLGWGVSGAILAWSLPVALGMIASWIILARLIRSELAAWRQQHAAGRRAAPVISQREPDRAVRLDTSRPDTGRPDPGRPDPGRHRATRRSLAQQRRYLAGEFWRFAAPRGFAGTFQIVVVWLDVLLVGALLSRYAAGIYAAVSKLALLGAYTLEATRLAIGPQLSKFLARHQPGSAAELHQSATRWLMIASFPFYMLAAIFPSVVLGIFGHKYTAGAAALTVLALAMLVNLGTGNVTVVLLMGGKSSLSAWNALAAMIVNIGLNLVLLPRMGIVGAAVAWAASIVVENVAAVIEVWLTMGIGAFGTGYWLVAVSSAGCFAASGLGARMLLHQTLPALLAAAAAGLIAFGAILYAARSQLQLSGLIAAMRARAAAAAPGQQPA